MTKLIKGLTLGVVLALSLVAAGADAFAADVKTDNAALVSGGPRTPAPSIKPFGVTWEE